MTDLMELASRVEAGEGPDRELDAAIWLHLPEQEGHAWKHGGDRYKHAHQIAGCSFVPAYTASTEASGSLALKAWDHLEVYPPRGKHMGWTVHVIPLSRAMFDTSTGYAPSYERALTAAWLRARAHQGAAHVDQ